ncbi:MAG: sulfotransferase domain-containing protein [Planctomycetota bacterium]
MAAPRSLDHAPLGDRLRAALRRSAPGRAWYRHRRNRMADAYVLSFPKTGRTWLRLLLGKAIATHHQLQDADSADLLELDRLADRLPDLPRIRFKHDDNPHFKTPDELVTRKTEYADRPVVFLVRDPRDTAVSAYHQLTKREARYRFDGSLEQFLDCPRGSVATMLRFYNLWHAERDTPKRFLLVRYEDLHADTAGQLRRVTDFLELTSGGGEFSDDTLAAAVDFARFDNMRRMEQKASQRDTSGGNARLAATDPNDPTTFKTRSGKIGDFVKHIPPATADALTQRVRDELDPSYGYPYEATTNTPV